MRLRRTGILTMLAVLLFAAMPLTAPASNYGGTVYFPPFEDGLGVSSQKLKAPCAPLSSPVSALKPAALTGRIDSSIGLAVRSCRFASVSRTDYVPLGEVPAALIGHKADLVAVIAVDGFRFVESGSGAARVAHLGFAMGRQFETPTRVLGIECAPVCKQLTPLNISNLATVTISRTIDSLPANLWMAVVSDAAARGATGAIGIEFRATLVSVAVRWLA